MFVYICRACAVVVFAIFGPREESALDTVSSPDRWQERGAVSTQNEPGLGDVAVLGAKHGGEDDGALYLPGGSGR